MSSVPEVISAYEKLCAYCDSFSSAVVKRYPGFVHCRRGCTSCCRLASVNALEAFLVYRYIQSLPPRPAAASRNGICCFLRRGECLAYSARPIICRTHGLPMKSSAEGPEKISICPRNAVLVRDAQLDPVYVLEADRVTDHLVRFNIAFCVVIQAPQLASERFPMVDVRRGRIDPLLIEAAKSFPFSKFAAPAPAAEG